MPKKCLPKIHVFYKGHYHRLTDMCKMSRKSAKDMEFENNASAWREDSTASLRRSSLWVVESQISDAVLY
jgi:hypothetical protein